MTRLLAALFALTPLTAADLFVDQIHPVLAKRCAGCHSGAAPQGGLSLESRARMFKGGASGPVIANRLLIRKMKGEAGQRMPPAGAPLTAAEIAAFERWISEGAPWPEMRTSASKWVAPLAPRRPDLPLGTAAPVSRGAQPGGPAAAGALASAGAPAKVNPIDRFLDAYAVQHKVKFAPVVSDARFARRAAYDVWGLPPAPAQLAAKDRAKLVDELLAESKNYTAHWISFWNDVLRNDIGVVYHGDRKPITAWLQGALEKNLAYDEMARQLLNPVGNDAPDGFLVGVNWRGDVNASQLPHIQASQNTAQIFLGINLKCASCHDSFINKYQLKQAYSLAAMFAAESRLELIRCDVKTGQYTEAEFLYPELGSVPAGATLTERRAAAAQLFTHPGNGRLARTIVNRYWRKLMGRGLVEPVDEMDNEPWNADLLDWLAVDLADHQYDLKHLIRQIMTSQAYQRPAVARQDSAAAAYVFQGPEARRLSAEQFLDTVSAITGEWRTLPTGDTARYVRDWELKSSALSRALGRPIRDQVYTTRNEEATTFQALELVNGSTLTTLLRRGARRLLGELPNPPANRFDSKPLRQGAAKFDVDLTGVKQLWLLTEDAGSYDPEQVKAGWAGVVLEDAAGVSKKLTELATVAKFTTAPMLANKEAIAEAQLVPLGTTMTFNLEGLNAKRLRGRVALDDASRASDIGGSARFYVFVQEPDRYQLVRVAGERPVAEPSGLGAKIDWDRFYLPLLGRRATPAEIAQLNGAAPQDRAANLEDRLWMLLMHPEFQYVL